MSTVISSFEIVFSNQTGNYYEGEAINGEVIVELKEDMVIENLQIVFRGTAIVHWPENENKINLGNKIRRNRLKSEETTIDEEQYLNQMICLYTRESNPQNELLVSVGRHSYPFTIQLPETLPPSFRGDYGYVTYTATALLERPFLPQIVVAKDFSIFSILDLNALNQEIMRPYQIVETESLGFCCVETGNITCDWRLARRGFVPGEQIEISGEIQNNCNLRIKRSKVALVQHTRYQGHSGNVIYQRKSVTKLEKPETPPGTIGFWRDKMTVPPNQPQSGLKGCNIISLWYTLKFKIDLVMRKPIETVIDVIIGSNVIRQPNVIENIARLSVSTDTSSHPDSTTEPDLSYFI